MEQKLIQGVKPSQSSMRVHRRHHEEENDGREERRHRWQEAVERFQAGPQGSAPPPPAQPVVNRAPTTLPPLQLMLEQVAEDAPAPQSLPDDQKRMLLRFRRDLRKAFGQLGLDRMSSSVALEHAVNTAAARLSAETEATADVMAAVYRLADQLKDPEAARTLMRLDPEDDEADPTDIAFR